MNKKSIREVNLDTLSYIAIPLKIFTRGVEDAIATCTGFIYRNNNDYYLITNWHNFTGKNCETKENLSSNGFVLPWQVEIPFIKTKTPYISWERHKFDLLDQNLSPKWLIHKIHKEKVDVVALELKVPENVIIHTINDINFNSEKSIVADDVFILGFPYGIRGGGNFPIWKRGSIATEPDIDFDSKPQILIDTATRTGMSGAPVIFRRSGIHGLINGKIVGESLIGRIQSFLGIYSGRYEGKDKSEFQLGIVWKEKVIKEIIEGKLFDLSS